MTLRELKKAQKIRRGLVISLMVKTKDVFRSQLKKKEMQSHFKDMTFGLEMELPDKGSTQNSDETTKEVWRGRTTAKWT